ncbi:MAG TPA: LpqB family beta-propeller domain-containing protein [Dermatophilaceae bacterium]|nr:LpqB family beta-propeller domain-containing protein [Dermatophilaceae bacterium]
MTAAARRCRVATMALLCALLGLLSACVTLPTQGPVEKAGGAPPGCSECVDIDVAPPTAGDQPKQIVDGYLRAMSNYQPNYAVARQYLTRNAADTWVPEQQTAIYTGATTGSGARVVLAGRLTATLDQNRTYTARNDPLKLDFQLVKENGEWRISSPPRGLLVAQYSFTRFYRPFNVFFVGNGRSLVPDPIYLPPRVNESTVLVQRLLAGASTWLKPGVTSAIPPNTTLTVSVTVREGVADVSLSDKILPLDDVQRRMMTAQVVQTLRQVEGVERIVFTVGQQPYRVPDSNPTDFTVPLNALPPEVSPMPSNAAEVYYGLSRQGVRIVDPKSDPVLVDPAPGPLGTGAYQVNAMAASVTNSTLAAVTDGRTVLRRASGDKISTLLSRVSNLLRPQFSRYDELFAIGDQGGAQRLWVITGDSRVRIDVSDIAGGRVTAFKVSPDGVRIALIRTVGGRAELGIGRINRAGPLTVDGWRTLNPPVSDTEALTSLVDVAWSDPTTLVLLGATTQARQVAPYRITQDGWGLASMGQPNNWDAIEVAVSLRNPMTTVIVGRTGKTWRDDGSQRWSPFVDGMLSMAFPD